jgi:hypothetical protein
MSFDRVTEAAERSNQPWQTLKPVPIDAEGRLDGKHRLDEDDGQHAEDDAFPEQMARPEAVAIRGPVRSAAADRDDLVAPGDMERRIVVDGGIADRPRERRLSPFVSIRHRRLLREQTMIQRRL